MPSKKQTKHETRRERNARLRRERRQRMLLAGFSLFAVLVVCAVLLATHLRTPKQRPDEWVVADGDVEIAALSLESGVNTLEVNGAATLPPFTGESDESGLEVLPGQPNDGYAARTLAPFFAAEPEQTSEPEPLPTPEPTQDAAYAPWEMPETTPEPAEETTSILITAVGDCTLGGDTKGIGFGRFEKAVKANGYDFFLKNVREYFENDDITIVNFEGTLTSSKQLRPGRAFNFRGHPQYVKILSGSSVEVCNMANNHSQDFGMNGMKDTAKILREAGIEVCGYSVACYQEVRGIKVGFVGFTKWDYSQQKAVNFVKKIRPTCDVLIVSYHWGWEGEYTADSFQKECGRALIDAGADLVLGHHPHVIGGVEKYHGKYIVYSLGNFCFGGNGNPADKDTMIFQQRLEIAPDGTVSDGGVNIVPCSVSSVKGSNNFQPMPLTGSESKRVLKKIAKYSKVKDPILLTMNK